MLIASLISELQLFFLKHQNACALLCTEIREMNHFIAILILACISLCAHSQDLVIKQKGKKPKPHKKYGVIDSRTGKKVIPYQYDAIEKLNDKYFIVLDGDKYGTIDHKNRQVIRTRYEELIETEYDDLFITYRYGEYGLINVEGKILTSAEHDEVRLLSRSALLVYKRDQFRLTDLNAKDLTGELFDFYGIAVGGNDLETIREVGHFIGYTKHKQGIYSTDGKTLCPAILDKVMHIVGTDRYIVLSKGKMGVIDFEGNKILPMHFDYIEELPTLDGNILTAEKRGKIGLYTVAGKEIFPPVLDRVNASPESKHFVVQNNGKQGLLSAEGEVVLAVIYDEVTCPSGGGHYVAKKDGKATLFDAQGTKVMPFKYETMSEIMHNAEFYFIASNEGKFGLIDADEQAVMPFIYNDLIYDANKENFWASKDGHYQAIDMEGKVLLPEKYQNIAVDYIGITRYQKTDGSWCKRIAGVEVSCDPPVYEFVDKLPEFPGGAQGLDKQVYEQLQYPQEALLDEREGVVLIGYTIAASGQVEDYRILRDPDPQGSLGAAALKALQEVFDSNRWVPAQKDGTQVSTRYNMPINFRLN